jgi:hypothetical protein
MLEWMGVNHFGFAPLQLRDKLMPITSHLNNEIRKLDGAGRLNLGKERAGEQYQISESDDGTIVLTPVAVIPKRELWLWKNPEALASVKRGLEQSAAGQTVSLGSFAQFLDEEDEE